MILIINAIAISVLVAKSVPVAKKVSVVSALLLYARTLN
jgi:hypothetical protein